MWTSVEQGATSNRWLVIDASRQNEIVVASVEPSVEPRPTQLYTHASAELPTFTDVLIRFERETVPG